MCWRKSLMMRMMKTANLPVTVEIQVDNLCCTLISVLISVCVISDKHLVGCLFFLLWYIVFIFIRDSCLTAKRKVVNVIQLAELRLPLHKVTICE